MSVVIRGMKMPKNCTECPFFIKSNSPKYSFVDCKIIGRLGSVLNCIGIPVDCPLVEIPAEHGRLGDLDAMAFDESEAYMSAQAKLGRDVITTGINSIVHRKIQLLIMDTPTVIEAEGVGE